MVSDSGPATWLTAIPLPYTGGDEFWGRDAGLICLGLRDLGVNCRFVALGPESQPTDAPVILTSLDNMRKAAWWRQWNADAVLFYCWAAPRYEPVSRAIHEAGSKLIVRLDTDGITSPRTHFTRFMQKTHSTFKEERKALPAPRAFAKALLFRMLPHLYDHKVIQHLRHADYIAIESPIALQRYRRFLTACGEPALGEKLRVIAHPVANYFRYDPNAPKQQKLLAIGRWESFFKDTPRMVRVIAQVLQREPHYRATIVGNGSEIVQHLLTHCDDQVRARIEVRPRIPQAELLTEYQQAQIILVSSRSESFHIASAAGLCCGCSVVGPASIPSILWFTGSDSGAAATSRSVNDLADAACAEIAAWQSGNRAPQGISSRWTGNVTVSAVSRQFIELVSPREVLDSKAHALPFV